MLSLCGPSILFLPNSPWPWPPSLLTFTPDSLSAAPVERQIGTQYRSTSNRQQHWPRAAAHTGCQLHCLVLAKQCTTGFPAFSLPASSHSGHHRTCLLGGVGGWIGCPRGILHWISAACLHPPPHLSTLLSPLLHSLSLSLFLIKHAFTSSLCFTRSHLLLSPLQTRTCSHIVLKFKESETAKCQLTGPPPIR